MLNFWQALSPDPVVYAAGPLVIRWYGLIMVVAIVSAYVVGRRGTRRAGITDNAYADAFFWACVIGLVGARVFHVFVFQWSYYRAHIGEIFNIWEGGIAIQGAVIFGALFLWWYAWRQKFDLWRVLDCLVPALALGQAIGRWGNFFNQELYGRPTSLPWAIQISYELRVMNYEKYSLFHPVFLYESILSLILFLILIFVRKKLKTGQLAALYLIGYGLIRILTESFKIDPQPLIGGVRLAQWIAGIFILGGVMLWWHFRRLVDTTPHDALR